MRKRLPGAEQLLHDLGLTHDMSVQLSRRRALWILGAVGSAAGATDDGGTAGSLVASPPDDGLSPDGRPLTDAPSVA